MVSASSDESPSESPDDRESEPTGSRDRSREVHVWRGDDEVETIPTTLLADEAGMAYRCANNFDWTMRVLTAEVRSVTGYDAGALLGDAERSFGDIIVPEDRTTVWYRVQRALNRDESFEFGYRIERSDGGIVRVKESGEGVYRDGHLVAIEGTIRLAARGKLTAVSAS